ncbi:succinyl-CoA:3-ketoacid-coenzyme A transferase [Limtongia smithiae]|uniref:succinyl-CoA:3-ketoacid-coenzyme A transferase n=1 Tax=Limtongia smithiae TaxID=1125753 RepID=UPI0034CE647D
MVRLHLRLVLSRRHFSGSAVRSSEINKLLPDAATALADMRSGATLLCGGFGLCGVPFTLLEAVAARPDVRDLTAVSNNPGLDGVGLGKLVNSGQISNMVASYVGENRTFEKMYLSGKIKAELVPQGTMAERCHAGAAGVPAFYTPTGASTALEKGEIPVKYHADGTVAVRSVPRETRVFNGKKYVLEEAIVGDYALVKAHRADRLGNCSFRYTAHNFNGVFGRAAKKTIVEADEIVEVGDIAPNDVHLPGIYVTAVVPSTEPKQFEKITLAKSHAEEEAELSAEGGSGLSKRERIVKRAAQEFKNGMYANVGIGMPMLSSHFIDPSVSVMLQSENGLLGLGPFPTKEQIDPDVVNAGKETVTLLPGACAFGSEESFGMIRSGRIHMSVLGAMQVSMYGDIANWMLPGKVKGMGGAMDLVANPEKTKVLVTMEHVDKHGRPKIVESCDFPLTGANCVSRVITDLAVFDIDFKTGMTLVEIADGTTVDELRAQTGAPFAVSDNLKLIKL